MSNATLRTDQWEKFYAFLKKHPRAYAGEKSACRLFLEDPDMENIILDSTVVRAHPCAAGASKKS